ncbi:MAG: hypothetical protein J6Y94_02605 [Bacteriovoracaceae bacterium]|nr:hypothetical protein [Bacteriovoracaceae bacterium]
MAAANICFCNAYPSLQKALQDLGISRQHTKRFLSAAQLHQPVAAHQAWALTEDVLHPQEINPFYQGPPIEILAEDELILALAKPPGIACHPLTYQEQNNCLSFLRQQGKAEVLAVAPEKAERGLLYRLDTLTSGILLAAKTAAVYRLARAALKNKIYQALVAGKFPAHLTGPHHQYFVASAVKGKKVKILPAANGQGRWGDLSIKLLQYNAAEDYSRLEIQLKTGLRHQIRASLAALGLPIIGDTFYGGRSAPRAYLHATTYEVQLPGGGPRRIYHCAPPF